MLVLTSPFTISLTPAFNLAAVLLIECFERNFSCVRQNNEQIHQRVAVTLHRKRHIQLIAQQWAKVSWKHRGGLVHSPTKSTERWWCYSCCFDRCRSCLLRWPRRRLLNRNSDSFNLCQWDRRRLVFCWGLQVLQWGGLHWKYITQKCQSSK